MRGLYIHIPFCSKKCPYCDFYSIPYERHLASKLIGVLVEEIRGLKEKGFIFDTIYIGGGTPSVLEREILEELLKVLGLFKDSIQEVTFEANPESLTIERLSLLKDYGINRLSIGLQSLDDKKLRFLGRLHNVKRGREVLNTALKKGFNNLSIDLIFGVPGERLEEWRRELEEVIRLPITHISCYTLTYEKNTPLYILKENKEILPLDNEIEYKMFKLSMERLPEKGFLHYEISSFSKKNFECRHNLKYWRGKEFIGLGPSAASFVEGRRFKNVSSLEDYLKLTEEGKTVRFLEEEPSRERLYRELLILGLRLMEGISLKDIFPQARLGMDNCLRKELSSLRKNGYIDYIEDNEDSLRVRLTPKGILFFDELAVFLIPDSKN